MNPLSAGIQSEAVQHFHPSVLAETLRQLRLEQEHLDSICDSREVALRYKGAVDHVLYQFRDAGDVDQIPGFLLLIDSRGGIAEDELDLLSTRLTDELFLESVDLANRAGPIPLMASKAQALNAVALPIEMIIAPRGPTYRLAIEMITTYKAA